MSVLSDPGKDVLCTGLCLQGDTSGSATVLVLSYMIVCPRSACSGALQYMCGPRACWCTKSQDLMPGCHLSDGSSHLFVDILTWQAFILVFLRVCRCSRSPGAPTAVYTPPRCTAASDAAGTPRGHSRWGTGCRTQQLRTQQAGQPHAGPGAGCCRSRGAGGAAR